MKPTIKSLWAQHKNDQLVLQELKNIPAAAPLLNRWVEYAVTNNMPAVFEWAIQQIPKHEFHNAVRLEQACVYNRNHMVVSLLRHNPLVDFNPALKSAAARGHMQVLDTLFNHIKTRHKWIWNEDWKEEDNKDLQDARFIIAQAACQNRQIEVLKHYIPYTQNDHDNYMSWISPLAAICAEKNFFQGLLHLIQWGGLQDWERIASLCSQPYALQSECMIVLLDNIPQHVSPHIMERTVGDALQRLVTVNSVDKLNHPDNIRILKALTQRISFENFMERKRSSGMLKKHHDALEDIWIRIQRDTIIENIEASANSSVKRKM